MVFIAQGDWEIQTHILHAFLQSGKIKAYLLEFQQKTAELVSKKRLDQIYRSIIAAIISVNSASQK